MQKVLAAAGVASRRECETLIAEGRVEVDGEVVAQLGACVDPFKQQIAIDGEPLPKRKRVYFAVNKPDGVVCTAKDPSGRPRVIDLLPPGVGRVFNVGRLDMASEGLILVTNDGDLANRLTHPRHGVEKLYEVQVAGYPDRDTLNEVRRGVYLDEGRVAFQGIRSKSRRKSSTLLEVTLDEGRNREIRRVLARVGHKVQRLTRIAVGPVRLGDLPSGAYRPLTREEVRGLRETTRVEAAPDQDATDRTPAKPVKPAKRKRRAPAQSGPRGTNNQRSRPSRDTAAPSRRIIGDDEAVAESSQPAEKPATGSARRKPAAAKKPRSNQRPKAGAQSRGAKAKPAGGARKKPAASPGRRKVKKKR